MLDINSLDVLPGDRSHPVSLIKDAPMIDDDPYIRPDQFLYGINQGDHDQTAPNYQFKTTDLENKIEECEKDRKRSSEKVQL